MSINLAEHLIKFGTIYERELFWSFCLKQFFKVVMIMTCGDLQRPQGGDLPRWQYNNGVTRKRDLELNVST